MHVKGASVDRVLLVVEAGKFYGVSSAGALIPNSLRRLFHRPAPRLWYFFHRPATRRPIFGRLPLTSIVNITVIGAGIVGICCASYLQRDGHRVTVIDRGAPGEGTSFGNAGILSPGSC